MKAMIFAAGLGTRLQPLTVTMPKALVEIDGQPLLEIAIRRLMDVGCREIIVNVHHFAGMVIDFLEKKHYFGIHIAISDEQALLLDTGGGLKKAAWFLSDGPSFLVCNVDVLTSLDLAKFYQQHLESGALATLAVRQRTTSRYFLMDKKMQLQGWQNVRSGELRWCKPMQSQPLVQPYAFSGLHALRPEIFEWMPQGEVFSIVDVYLKAAAARPVTGYLHDEDVWMDVGNPSSLASAAELWRSIKNHTTT